MAGTLVQVGVTVEVVTSTDLRVTTLDRRIVGWLITDEYLRILRVWRVDDPRTRRSRHVI